MDIARHPELLDRLAAAHALGTLRGGARRRFETLARRSPQVRAAALLWHERWSALTELQPAVQPDAAVWARIANQLQADADAAAMQRARSAPSRRAALSWWRAGAVLGACATVAAVAVGLWSHQQLQRGADTQLAALRARAESAEGAMQALAQMPYVAVLAGEQAGASVLVAYDARSQALVLQRVGGVPEPADRSLQLWALPAQGAPQSLGVLGRERVLRLPAAPAPLHAAVALAISLEPLGGVPGDAGPTGPVLFKGALIRRQV